MKLSVLVYQIVIQAVYYEKRNTLSLNTIRRYANELTTTEFREEGITIDKDYKRTLDNAFNALNKALQRYASMDKLEPKIYKVNNDDIKENKLDLSKIEDLDNVLNVFYYDGRVINTLEYRSSKKNELELLEKPNKTFFIEYYPELKFFDFSDIALGSLIDNDFELSDYGISNKACSLIILWCKGDLGRDIYGDNANQWINQAESYMYDLPDFNGATLHYQNKIDEVYSYEN